MFRYDGQKKRGMKLKLVASLFCLNHLHLHEAQLTSSVTLNNLIVMYVIVVT